MTDVDSERVVVLAPIGRDAALTCSVLRDVGFTAEPVVDGAALRAAIDEGVGAAVIALEALADALAADLAATLAHQPAWSDLPLVVLGTIGGPTNAAQVDRLAALGNVTLLERPVAVRELATAVRAALRGRRRQYDARRAIAHRDQFLAMLGHELRNPLAAISLAANGLQRSADPARRERHVGVVLRQTAHLARLVDDLLDVARLTTGRIALSRAPVDVGAQLRACLAVAEETARARGLSLVASVPEGPLVVDGDADRLQQVFANLVGNALKYTPASGRIEVEAAAVDGEVVVRVKDTGVGIAPDVLPRVFELFVQAPEALDRAQGGLGIGLTLVQQIVALHGGRVVAKSDGPGRGTEMTVTLPRVVAPVAGVAPRGGTDTTRRRRRVVVVEDSDDVREALTVFYGDLGHDVTTARDGPTGLAQILALEPDLAVVDIGLPGLDGFEVARRARAVVGSRVRLAAVTGYGQPGDRARTRAAGFDAHLTKPVRPVDLEALLDD